MSTSSPEKMIVLQSSDGQNFEIEEKVVALKSQAIKTMIESGVCAATTTTATIPLAGVSSKILTKVIEYCKRHVQLEKSMAKYGWLPWCHDDIERNLKVPHVQLEKSMAKYGWLSRCHDDLERNLKNFDADFINVDERILFDLLLAAYYLKIESLLDLCYKTVADMMNEKSAVEIITILGLDSLTPEEKYEIRRENP